MPRAGFADRGPVVGTPPRSGIHPPGPQVPAGNRSSRSLVLSGFPGQVDCVAGCDGKQERSVADRDDFHPQTCPHASTVHQRGRSALSPQMTVVHGSEATLLVQGEGCGVRGGSMMPLDLVSATALPAVPARLCRAACRVAASSAVSIELRHYLS